MEVNGKTRMEELGRNELRSLLDQCNERQVHLFNLMYKSVDRIPLDKIPWAIEQCERTIQGNKEKENGVICSYCKRLPGKYLSSAGKNICIDCYAD